MMMLRPLGELALYAGTLFAAIQSFLPLYGYYRKNPYFLAFARSSAWGQFCCLVFAYSLLTFAFALNDFSIAYVAANSHPSLPLIYRLTAVWGAHEGSILLWVFVLSIWTIAFIVVNKNKKLSDLAVLTLAVLGLLNFCFLCFLLLTSNPFALALSPQSGNDLNPLLQDPGFVVHPPMLYIGYVGFSVTFALTQAALLRNQLDQAWAKLSRQFAIAAWCFLTVGIALGSWWAYRILGWGGFWFWDPVENASLLPWLASTAFIHLMVLVQKKAIAKAWAVVLANITFALSLLGTFLVRSGILISAHTFANDPARGLFLLIIFTTAASAALVLFVSRIKLYHASPRAPLSLWSRETSLLINSALLFTALLIVLLGTLYPLILDTLHFGNISVGAPYFNTVLLPLTLLLMLFMGIGAEMQWQEEKRTHLFVDSCKKLIISFMAGFGLAYLITGDITLVPALTLSLTIWISLTVLRKKKFFSSLALSHIGFAVLVIGIILSSTLQLEREVRIKPGESVNLGIYDFLFLGTRGIKGSNYLGIQAAFDVTKMGRHIINLYPEKRIYTVRKSTMTTADIHPSIFRDLYMALGEPLEENNWSVRLYYKPFIRFIWAGAFLMTLGGLSALFKNRQRNYSHDK